VEPGNVVEMIENDRNVDRNVGETYEPRLK
jgi:hypothetical protein